MTVQTPLSPLLQEGEFVKLRVEQVSERGLYLAPEGDSGAEQLIFMPRGEIRGLPVKGESVWTGLYLTGERLTATMKLDKIALRHSVPAVGLTPGKTVRGFVYNLTEAGAFLRTAEGWLGHIPTVDLAEQLQIGQQVEGRVTFVREDGRFNLSTRPVKEVARLTDAEKILEYLRRSGGTMPISDESTPEVIMETFGISKKAFKRAVGKLLKDGLIEQTAGITRLKS